MIKVILLIVMIIATVIWIIHVIIAQTESPFLILIYPEFYVVIVSVIGFSLLYLKSWKYRIYVAESDILETIAYREKTSIKNIAKIKNLKEGMVELIINRLIAQERLFGTVKDGLFISEKAMIPICSLCNKDIVDQLLMTLCPYCKRPFHKDHIIDYINEVDGKCPNCDHPLGLADIIK